MTDPLHSSAKVDDDDEFDSAWKPVPEERPSEPITPTTDAPTSTVSDTITADVGAEVPIAVRTAPLVRDEASEAAMWQSVATLQAKSDIEDSRHKGGLRDRDTELSPITFTDAMRVFDARDYQSEMQSIVPENKPSNVFFAVIRFIFGPPRLASKLVAERDRMFCMARVALDHAEIASERVLQTVYMKLTGQAHFLPSIGPHWDAIGFQGADPVTDLRGVGMFGLLQLLYLTTKHRDIAVDIYRLSRNEQQQFPFCVASLSISKIALEALRAGKLNKEANKRGDVVSVVMEFYAGSYYRLFKRWKREHLTIREFGFALRELDSYCKANAVAVIKEFLQATTRQVTASSAPDEVRIEFQ